MIMNVGVSSDQTSAETTSGKKPPAIHPQLTNKITTGTKVLMIPKSSFTSKNVSISRKDILSTGNEPASVAD